MMKPMPNFMIILSLREPDYHKGENKEKILSKLGASLVVLARIELLRVLVILMSVFAVVEIFKGEFGQLYMLRYASSPEIIGLLWAAYAIAWAFGNLIAHKLYQLTNALVILSVLPLILMSFIDSWFGIVLFMIQAVASAAMLNQIETKIQHNTPSNVRASILSVVNSIGRVIVVPSGLLIGWLIRDYDVLWALRFVSLLALASVIYYFINTKFAKSSIRTFPVFKSTRGGIALGRLKA